jgi:hypothetical protein
MCDEDVLGSICDGDVVVLGSEIDDNDGNNAADEESGMLLLLLKPMDGLLSTKGWE